MDFVEVEHPKLGRTFVSTARLPHMAEGWAVVEGDEPRAAKDSRRVTRKANTSPENPEASAQAAEPTEE